MPEAALEQGTLSCVSYSAQAQAPEGRSTGLQWAPLKSGTPCMGFLTLVRKDLGSVAPQRAQGAPRWRLARRQLPQQYPVRVDVNLQEGYM